MRRFLSPCLVAVLFSACIVEAPGAPKGGSPGTPERARPGGQVPPIQVKVGANLEDKVEVVGATVQPGAIYPGEQAKVTAYYRVLAPLEQDYMIFVHVEDVDGRAERLNVDHLPAGGTYRTPQWKPGETIKDEFTVYAPPGTNVRGLNVWMGFWQPQTDQRLRLKNVDQVKNDGTNRLLLVTIPVMQ